MNLIRKFLKSILNKMELLYKSRQGAALLSVMAVMFTLFILVTATLLLVSYTAKSDSYHQYETEAYDVADAGLKDGVKQLNSTLIGKSINSNTVKNFLATTINVNNPIAVTATSDPNYHMTNNRYTVIFKPSTVTSGSEIIYAASVGYYGVNSAQLNSTDLSQNSTDTHSLYNDKEKHAIRTMVAKVTANLDRRGNVQSLKVNTIAQGTSNDPNQAINQLINSTNCGGQTCDSNYWQQTLDNTLGSQTGSAVYGVLTYFFGPPNQWPPYVFTLFKILGIY